jgi:hypothetical protein
MGDITIEYSDSNRQVGFESDMRKRDTHRKVKA